MPETMQWARDKKPALPGIKKAMRRYLYIIVSAPTFYKIGDIESTRDFLYLGKKNLVCLMPVCGHQKYMMDWFRPTFYKVM